MSRVFSGIQPSGGLHLGNYLGAIRNWVRLQDTHECLYCVVDLHAITVRQEPEELRHNTREAVAGLVAAGIDPARSILFNQSRNPDHAELAWILNCTARLGWLDRMTQFKEKAGSGRRDAERVSVGLYVYPNLMAADILAYQATHVPVGEDQKQHLELCRDIARKFNGDFDEEVFPQPEPLILPEASRVMSLQDGAAKMSKSDPAERSRINLTDDADAIATKIKRARTDPEPLPSEVAGLENRPEAANLVGIYAAFVERSLEETLAEVGGARFSDFKQRLTDLAVERLSPVSSEMRRLMGDLAALDAVMQEGAEKARALSAPVLQKVRATVGLLTEG